MKKRNVLITILLVICMASLFGFTASAVYAGDVTKEILNEDFSSKRFASDLWYSANSFDGTSFETSDKLKAIVKNGGGSNGIISKIKIDSDSVTVRLDINKLVFGDKDKEVGMFGIAYNLANTSTSPADIVWNNIDRGNVDGVYFAVKANQLVFASISGKATDFVDGNNKKIEQRTQWKFFDASAISDTEGDKITINQKSIYLCFDNKGNLEVKAKTLGSSDTEQTVIKTTSPTLNPLSKNTYIGLSCAQSASKIESLDLGDFHISDGDKVFNDFSIDNSNNWKVIEAGLTDEISISLDTSMVINSDFSEDYPIIMRKKILINDFDDVYSDLVLEATIKSLDLSENSKFGFALGLDRYTSSKPGDENTTFVYFKKNGNDLYLGAESYGENGAVKELFKDASVKISEDTGYIDLSVTVDNKGKLTVKNADNVVYESQKDKEAFAANYAAIAINGESKDLNAAIKSVKMTNTYYDRPENTDINATFDDGGFNVNEWNLISTPYLDTYTNSAYVKDEKLFFDNCAMNSAFITQYQYSDFEIQFDIDDIRREVVGNGASKSFPISSFIGVYWGVSDAWHKFGSGVSTSFPLVYIATEIDQQTWDRKIDSSTGKPYPTEIFMLGNGLNNRFSLPDKYDFWSLDNADKVLQFKITVTGKKVVVAVRYKGEEAWQTTDRNNKLMSNEMDIALTGNVAITTMGNNYFVKDISEGASCGHFSVDNVILTNKDIAKNTITVEYVTSKKDKIQDYQYTKPDNDADYKPVGNNDNSDNTGCSSAINVSGVVLPLAALSLVAIIIKARRCKDE